MIMKLIVKTSNSLSRNNLLKNNSSKLSYIIIESLNDTYWKIIDQNFLNDEK